MNRKNLLILFYLLCFSSQVFSHHIEIRHARIHEGPPSQKILAAYMTMTNKEHKPHTITHIKSTYFEHIEIHKTVLKNGIAKMQRQKNLSIPANSQLELSPGSYHLMLFNPSKRITAGNTIELEFILDDGTSFKIETPVIKASSTSSEHANHH